MHGFYSLTRWSYYCLSDLLYVAVEQWKAVGANPYTCPGRNLVQEKLYGDAGKMKETETFVRETGFDIWWRQKSEIQKGNNKAVDDQVVSVF